MIFISYSCFRTLALIIILKITIKIKPIDIDDKIVKTVIISFLTSSGDLKLLDKIK